MRSLGNPIQKIGEAAWRVFQAVNTRLPPSAPADAAWAPGPLLKSHERSRPPLGYPRETDSLCPRCVIETREPRSCAASGDLSDLVNGHLGEIKATLYEQGNQVRVSKTCPEHGTFEDLHLDRRRVHRVASRAGSRAATSRTLGDELVHRHGTSTISYGRGAVLTIDLTNRCNMMCNPCFMDANQVGYVHELTIEEMKKILDDSISFKPRRQMSVQFSGGEPTMSPHFLEACRLRQEGRLPDDPGRDQRPALRARAGLRLPGEGGRASTWSTSSSTASPTRPTPTATSRTCSTCKTDRHRQPGRGRHQASRRWSRS